MSSFVLCQLFWWWWWWWFVCSGVGSLGSSHWELMGYAMVTTDQVRLTPDMQSRQGAVWSRIVSTLMDKMKHHHLDQCNVSQRQYHYPGNNASMLDCWRSSRLFVGIIVGNGRPVCISVFDLCVSSLVIWRTGRCRCTSRFMGKERKTSMVMDWPSGTPKNAYRRVSASGQRPNVYIKRNSVWSIFAFCVLILSQVLYLEIWTTSLAWECLWTLIPMRRNTSRYAEAAPLRFYMCVYMFGRSKGGLRTSASHRQTLLKTLVKGLCVLLCNHLETGTEEKIYSSHTGNLHLERLISNLFLTSLSSLHLSWSMPTHLSYVCFDLSLHGGCLVFWK